MAGYAIKDDFDGVLKEFDAIVGLDRIKVLHVNDSQNPMGAAKDRHANLGMGHIGFDALLNVIETERFKDIPKILETPYVTEDEDSKKRIYPPYKFEIEMVKSRQFDPSFIETIRQS